MNKPPELLQPLDHIPADIHYAADYERLAGHFIPNDRLAYIAGGSGDEVTLEKNREAFLAQAIIPKPLVNVSDGSSALTLANEAFAHPFLLAPLAYQTLIHPLGEQETARAAQATDTCLIASTLSSVNMEVIAEHASSQRWFQLYLQPTWEDTITLIKRAAKADYKAIVLTIDAAAQQPSRSAMNAGFQFPADLIPANLKDANRVQESTRLTGSIFQRYMATSVTYADIERLLTESPLPVFVKGVLNPEDALQLKSLGVAGIIVSNHGGRTIDHVPATLSVLPSIRHAVGPDYPVLVDSGIRSGADAFKAIANGANAVLVGRLQVYALSIAGALGVAHMLKLLREELELTMAIAGCTKISEINPSNIREHSPRSRC